MKEKKGLGHSLFKWAYSNKISGAHLYSCVKIESIKGKKNKIGGELTQSIPQLHPPLIMYIVNTVI